MSKILLFYAVSYIIGFVLCIVPGPVAIEVFHHAVKRQSIHALSIGFGAAMGDAVWAVVVFYGISPFLKNGRGSLLEGIFLLVAAVVTFIIGFIALKDARFVKKVLHKEEGIVRMVKRKRKRWSVLKGLTMVLVNPLCIGTWVIVLSFLRKAQIYIPLDLNYIVFFVLAVMLGAFSYSILMVAITNRFKPLFNPDRTSKIIKVLGYVLILFAFYFLFYALRALFFLNA
jgi:threonine/homoserine/homoserine lactone efflux protein